MNLEDYNALPDSLDPVEVEHYCNLILDEAISELPKETLRKLRLLGDRQWHCYEVPSKGLQQRLRKWCVNNWTESSPEFLEGVLVTAYNFALDKEFYKTVLERYNGTHLAEFKLDLEKSLGDFIDPWWSYRENK